MASLVRRIPFARRDPASGPAKPTSADGPPPPKNAPSASDHSNVTPTFSTLPPEIHELISKQLIYPDALSLKHTNRYFYNLVDTGVKLKINWLVERRRLHLECPNDRRCDLGSDLKFCRGSVRCAHRLLMQRRREHIECESRPGLGCLINGTSTCPHSRQLKTRLKRWMRVRLSIEVWGLLLAIVVLVAGWLLTCNVAY
ncbi:hypothetical protein OQA88_7133 [Cercophora sp. LCS_1]